MSPVRQVWEGRVLPGRCRVLHRVWECIGEKRSGIQVPVPYVFRNCGINQVSVAKHIQKSSGWERGKEEPLDLLMFCHQLLRSLTIKLDHLPVCSSCWGLKCFPAGWDPFCWGSSGLSTTQSTRSKLFQLLPSQRFVRGLREVPEMVKTVESRNAKNVSGWLLLMLP